MPTARMFSASGMFLAKIVEAIPNEKFGCVPGECLHRLDRLRRFVESVLDRAHLVVDVADAVERDTDADQHALRRAELDDLREHRDGARRREAGGVDPDLPQTWQMLLKHLHHLRQIKSRHQYPTRDIEFDCAPERRVEDRLELIERHVRLAIAPFPVVAHRALGVGGAGAVVDQNCGTKRMQLGVDEGIDEVARDACRSLGEVVQSEAVGCHQEQLPSYQPQRA